MDRKELWNKYKKEIKDFSKIAQFVQDQYNIGVVYGCTCGCGGDWNKFLDSVDKLDDLNVKYKWLLKLFNHKETLKNTLERTINHIIKDNKDIKDVDIRRVNWVKFDMFTSTMEISISGKLDTIKASFYWKTCDRF